MALYLDGNLAGQVLATGDITGAALPFEIGQLFIGDVDELAIYPTALSPARVLVHFTVGSTGHH